MWIRVIAASVISVIAGAALGQARFTQGELQRLLRNKIQSIQELAANEIIVQSVRRQNQRDLSLEEIRKIDEEWQSTPELTPFKKSLQENEVGKYFKSTVDFNQAIFSELFLTDRRGANVAAYPATTDYWQGDEKKWIEAFDGGSGQVYVGPVEFDKSTQVNAVQVSVPVMDAGKAIGVLVVGLKLTYLQARYLGVEWSASAGEPPESR